MLNLPQDIIFRQFDNGSGRYALLYASSTHLRILLITFVLLCVFVMFDSNLRASNICLPIICQKIEHKFGLKQKKRQNPLYNKILSLK